MSNTEKTLIGYVGVDSGQILIGDPAYLVDNQFTDNRSDSFDIGENREGPYSHSYEGACNASLSESSAGILTFHSGIEGSAAVCSSGFGDGQYPVYVEYSNENEWGVRVKSVTIDFIPVE